MAKTINPKVTMTEGKTIQTIWTGIPDFKMGILFTVFRHVINHVVVFNVSREVQGIKRYKLTVRTTREPTPGRHRAHQPPG